MQTVDMNYERKDTKLIVFSSSDYVINIWFNWWMNA